VQTQNLVPTEDEMENHQQKVDISKLKEKIESTYYQVKQIEISKIPKLQKIQSMFKIKEMMKTANEATTEKLKDKDLNTNDINHLIYAAATVITEEENEHDATNHGLRVQKHFPGLDAHSSV
jgi:hypothetical protein